MEYLNTLNTNQKAAALWDNGPLMVLAGPGSGKTATLTARVARLVEQSDDESFRILCLTFTRKAAAEMRRRLLKLVPAARDRVLLTTFHSFAADILRQHGSHFGLSPDFEIIEDAERIKLMKSLLLSREAEFAGLWSAEKALTSLNFLFSNVIEDANVSTVLKDPEVGKQLLALFSAYKEALKEQNALDYGAILYFCEELLRTRPRLAKQLRNVYQYVCVDEFQDTNVAQYRLLRALAPERNSNIFIVGDDDQVIYQWNGASPARVKELASHYDLTTIQLPENYRCPPEVVALANALIQCNGDRASDKKPLMSMKKASDTYPVQLEVFENENEEASWVAEQIARKLSTGVNPVDMVVLARNTKLLEGVFGALSNIGITAHVQRRKAQFESAPLRLIVSALKLAAVRSDEEVASIVTKALSDCIDVDVSLEDLDVLAAQANGDQLEALGTLASNNSALPKDVRDAISCLVLGRFGDFISGVLTYYDFIQEQELGTEGSELFTDYPSEREVWRGIMRDLGDESDAYAMSLGQFLQELVLANKTPEAPQAAVRCLTIHASKGMEFNHVFLIGLVEDQLPSFQSKKGGADGREMQEERRNCFVAITRTIETLALSYAKRYNGWGKQPSRFLTEMFELDDEENV